MSNKIKLSLLIAVPLVFSGCLPTAAAVASIASSAYTLKDALSIGKKDKNLNKNEEIMLKNPPEDFQEQEMVDLYTKPKDYYIARENQQNSQLQNYYAYPVVY